MKGLQLVQYYRGQNFSEFKARTVETKTEVALVFFSLLTDPHGAESALLQRAHKPVASKTPDI